MGPLLLARLPKSLTQGAETPRIHAGRLLVKGSVRRVRIVGNLLRKAKLLVEVARGNLSLRGRTANQQLQQCQAPILHGRRPPPLAS